MKDKRVVRRDCTRPELMFPSNHHPQETEVPAICLLSDKCGKRSTSNGTAPRAPIDIPGARRGGGYFHRRRRNAGTLGGACGNVDVQLGFANRDLNRAVVTFPIPLLLFMTFCHESSPQQGQLQKKQNNHGSPPRKAANRSHSVRKNLRSLDTPDGLEQGASGTSRSRVYSKIMRWDGKTLRFAVGLPRKSAKSL